MSPNSDSILSQELSRRTALKALFGAASAAVLFGLPTRAHAAEASKETTDKLNAAQAQLDEVQAQLDSIANEYAALASKNAQTLNDIEGVQGQIDDTQAQIDEKKAELKKKRGDLSDRVAASYKSGGTNILSLLLASGSFEELVANAHYVEKINKSDRDAIEDIQTIQAELDAQKTELEAQKADLEKLKDQQTAQMQDMQAKQQEVQTVLNGLSDDVKELMAQRDPRCRPGRGGCQEGRRRCRRREQEQFLLGRFELGWRIVCSRNSAAECRIGQAAGRRQRVLLHAFPGSELVRSVGYQRLPQRRRWLLWR